MFCIKAIIFDMDGVIVDTEYHHLLALEGFIQAKNPTITWDELTTVTGSSGKHFFNLLHRLAQTDESVAEIKEQFWRFNQEELGQLDYLAIFRADIQHIIDFAHEKDLKLAVASSSKMPVINDVLTTCGLDGVFDCVVSGADFPESKPHPAIYLHTAATLGFEPSECLTIEDSTFGIAAAKSAGIVTVAYEDTRLNIDQSGADYLAQGMLGALRIIKSLYNSEKRLGHKS